MHTGWEEDAEAIESTSCSHVDQAAGVGLPVLQTGNNVLPAKGFMLCARLLICLQTVVDSEAIFWGQECSFVGKVMDHPDGYHPNDDGDEALEDEDPSPASFAANAVHLADRRS